MLYHSAQRGGVSCGSPRCFVTLEKIDKEGFYRMKMETFLVKPDELVFVVHRYIGAWGKQRVTQTIQKALM